MDPQETSGNPADQGIPPDGTPDPVKTQIDDNDSQSHSRGDNAPLGEGGKRALDAERKARKEAEARLKELEPLADEYRKRQEADKSETQKQAEALAAERDARTKAETTLLRYAVGADKGLQPKLYRFLTGTTREEIEQAADELLAVMASTAPAMPGRPTERMANGQPSKSGLDDLDPMTLIAKGRGQTK